jgi:hypothetical protein
MKSEEENGRLATPEEEAEIDRDAAQYQAYQTARETSGGNSCSTIFLFEGRWFRPVPARIPGLIEFEPARPPLRLVKK